MDSDHELLIIGWCIALVVILVSLQPGESLVGLLGRLYKSQNDKHEEVHEDRHCTSDSDKTGCHRPSQLSATEAEIDVLKADTGAQGGAGAPPLEQPEAAQLDTSSAERKAPSSAPRRNSDHATSAEQDEKPKEISIDAAQEQDEGAQSQKAPVRRVSSQSGASRSELAKQETPEEIIEVDVTSETRLEGQAVVSAGPQVSEQERQKEDVLDFDATVGLGTTGAGEEEGRAEATTAQAKPVTVQRASVARPPLTSDALPTNTPRSPRKPAWNPFKSPRSRKVAPPSQL